MLFASFSEIHFHAVSLQLLGIGIPQYQSVIDVFAIRKGTVKPIEEGRTNQAISKPGRLVVAEIKVSAMG